MLNRVPSDEELAVKGLAALSLTRNESEASFMMTRPLESLTATLVTISDQTIYGRIMQDRSPHCRHTKHEKCSLNVLYGFLKNFRGGFIASLVLSAIPLILKVKIKKLIMMFVSKQIVFSCCKLALFSGLMNGIYKTVLCLLRRLFRADDTERANKISAPIAGFIAGFTLMCESKFRKQYLTVFAMSRLIDSGLNLFHKEVPK